MKRGLGSVCRVALLACSILAIVFSVARLVFTPSPGDAVDLGRVHASDGVTLRVDHGELTLLRSEGGKAATLTVTEGWIYDFEACLLLFVSVLALAVHVRGGGRTRTKRRLRFADSSKGSITLPA